MNDDDCGLRLWPWRRRKDSGSGKSAGRKAWRPLGLAAGAIPLFFLFLFFVFFRGYIETRKEINSPHRFGIRSDSDFYKLLVYFALLDELYVSAVPDRLFEQRFKS
jgi:hypothetical protein